MRKNEQDSNSLDITRGEFLGISGALMLALAINNSGCTAEQRPEILSTIEAAGNKRIVEMTPQEKEAMLNYCASDYIKQTGIPTTPTELLSRTFLYNSAQDFIDGVRNNGLPEYNPNLENIDSAWTVYENSTVHMNLEEIDKDSIKASNPPCLTLIGLLYHEWNHSIAKERHESEILSQHLDYFEVNGIQEPWIKYRGMEIYFTNDTGFYYFNEALIELITQDLVLNLLSSDEDITEQMKVTFTDSWAYKPSDKLRNLMNEINKYRKNTNQEAVTLHTLLAMYSSSDVEGVFKLMGSIFTDEALSLLTPVQVGNRDATQIQRDRDFLIGKRMAVIIHNDAWNEYDEMFKYVRV